MNVKTIDGNKPLMEIITGKYHVTVNGNWKVQAD